MARLAAEVIRPEPGMRVIDLGCGNGRLVPFLGEGIEYVGVDNHAGYVAAARERYGSPNVEFVVGDVTELESLRLGRADVVVCIGILHHLDDDAAAAALRSARALLSDGGRIVTLDGCYEPTQHWIARVLLALDRGRFVRHPGDYERLAAASFRVTSRQIWTDLYQFPYTHIVLVGESLDQRAV
jgi:SAM-dependent methyltransferase